MRWNWYDTSSSETGYKIYTTTGGVLADGLASDLTYYARTDMAPNTEYRTYIVALGDATD